MRIQKPAARDPIPWDSRRVHTAPRRVPAERSEVLASYDWVLDIGRSRLARTCLGNGRSSADNQLSRSEQGSQLAQELLVREAM